MTNTHPFLPLRYAYTVDICVDLLDTRNFVQSLHYQGNEPLLAGNTLPNY